MADASGVESPVMWLSANDRHRRIVMTFSMPVGNPYPSTDLWGELDGDVLRLLGERPEGLSPAEIGHKIGMSEDAVRSVLTMLAQEGKVRMQGGTVNGTQG
jgi:hypothetical protein